MQQLFFDIDGIHAELEPRPAVRREIVTLEEVEAIMQRNSMAILPVVGDCMEAAGIMDGGWVAVAFDRFPAPPRYKSKGGDGSADACLCYGVFPGTSRPLVMTKEYCGLWGPWHMVGTRYDLSKGKHSMNCGMQAEKIFGVIFASWDANRRLLWKRELESFPDSLGTVPTIRGGNIGDPEPVKEVRANG